jgi:hypothetical protein
MQTDSNGKKISSVFKFYRTTILLFICIIIATFTILSSKTSRGDVIVLFVGGALTFISCTIFNLIYFLPISKTELRFLLPGILTSITSAIIWWKSEPDAVNNNLEL